MSNLIAAYSTNDHLLLDLDHTTHSKVIMLCNIIKKEYSDLGGFMILESTPPEKADPIWHHPAHSKPIITQKLGGYHAIFLHKLSWKRIMHILKTLTGLGIYTSRHLKIRKFRKDLTLRISHKPLASGHKPPPHWKTLLPCCSQCWDFIAYYIMLMDAVNCQK